MKITLQKNIFLLSIYFATSYQVQISCENNTIALPEKQLKDNVSIAPKQSQATWWNYVTGSQPLIKSSALSTTPKQDTQEKKPATEPVESFKKQETNFLKLSSFQKEIQHDTNPSTQQNIQIIDAWISDYGTTTSNVYIQENLKDDLLNLTFKTNQHNKKLELINTNIDLAKTKKEYEKLLEKYKDNHEVIAVINQVVTTINQYLDSQKSITVKTNNLLQNFYTSEQALQLLELMHIPVEVDPTTGKLKNIPSIDMIIKEARINPTQKTFDALNIAIQVTRTAKRTISQNSSLGSSDIKNQLKIFDQALNKALTNPRLDQYKNFLLQNTIELTGYDKMTIKELLDYTSSGLQQAGTIADQISAFKNNTLLKSSGYVFSAATGYARMGLTGALIDTALYHIAQENIPSAIESIKNMTLKDFVETMTPSEKTSIYKAHETIDIMNSDTVSLSGELQKFINGTNQEQILKAQQDANKEITNYYYEKNLQDAIFNLMHIEPIIDHTKGGITNIPSIENIIEEALKNPSKKSYEAIQAAIKATDTAIYVTKYNLFDFLVYKSLKVKQLYLYKEQLLQALNNPAIIKYKPIISQVSDYATSFVPKSTTLLEKTGIMDTTFDELSQGKTNTNKLINATLKNTSLGSTTLHQALTQAEFIPALPTQSAVQ